METSEFIDETSEFIGKTIETLDKKILIFAEDQINNTIQEIHIFAEDRMSSYELATELEVCILEELVTEIDEKLAYYSQRQQQSYDYGAFKSAGKRLLIAAALCGLVCFIYTHYDLPKHKELDTIIEELKNFGITLKKCSEGWGKGKSYYLEISAEKDFTIPLYKSVRIKSLVKQAFELHKAIYGWIRWSLIIVGVFTYMCLHDAFSYIRTWLRPHYKLRYEKWCFIKDKLCEAQNNLL